MRWSEPSSDTSSKFPPQMYARKTQTRPTGRIDPGRSRGCWAYQVPCTRSNARYVPLGAFAPVIGCRGSQMKISTPDEGLGRLKARILTRLVWRVSRSLGALERGNKVYYPSPLAFVDIFLCSKIAQPVPFPCTQGALSSEMGADITTLQKPA